MNNSKKLKPKKVKEVKLSEKPITSISKPWIIGALVLVVILVGAILFDQFYSPVLMKIDGKNYTLKDLSYYFYTVESSYDSYDQMLGGKYWDMNYDKKTTMRDQARKDAIDQILKYEMLNTDAVKAGYQLTDKEKATVKSNVDSLFSGKMPANVIKKNHYTKAYLTKMLDMVTLVQRYRTDQIAKLKVDHQKIKDSISYDQYRQYNIEYVYIPTQVTDSSGKTTKYTAEEKSDALKKITAAYDKIKSSDDWSKLVQTDYPELYYKVNSFVDNDNTFSKDFEAMMEKMKNNDVSTVYEDTTGYYIVRMKDNNSSEAYDNAVSSAIAEAENTAFDKWFKTKVLPEHNYTLRDKAIKSLKMGSVTLP